MIAQHILWPMMRRAVGSDGFLFLDPDHPGRKTLNRSLRRLYNRGPVISN